MTTKDISVHGNVAYRRDGALKFRESAVDWSNPPAGQSMQTLQTSEVFVRRAVKSASLGIDYSLGEKESLSLSGRYNGRHSQPWFDVLNVSRRGVDETVYHRISDGPNEQSDRSAALSYDRQGKGTALKAMIQHSDMVGLIDKSYSDVFVRPAQPTDYSHGATRSERRLDQATVDWTESVERGQWGFGVDLQKRRDNIHNYQAAVDPVTRVETSAADTTNSYVVETATTAAYLTYMLRQGKWEALLGGRAERLALDTNPVQAAISTDHWRAFNPSLNLRYAASDRSDFTLNYRRSLQMPDPRDLNPFTTYIDAQNLSRGNAHLQPQRVSSWEVGTNLDTKSVDGNLGAFYRTSRDTVTDARGFVGNVVVISKANGGRARSVGLTGSVDWKASENVQFGIDAGVYRVVLDTPDFDSMVREHAVSGYMNVRTSYSAGPDDLSLDAHGQSGGITPLGRYGATSNVNLTWKRKLSRTFSLTVNANDIFDGSKRTYSTHARTFRQAGFDHFVTRRLYVGFVKKFD